MKGENLWHTLAANQYARRLAALLVGALLGAIVEQVALFGVLPPEVVLALRAALSASSW